MEFHFLTLFPKVFEPFLGASLMEKASKRGAVRYGLTQIRDFATDKHRTVDDAPYGGGEGMVMRADVLQSAWKSVLPSGREPGTLTVFLSPQGRLFNQQIAHEWVTKYKKIVLVCGHYEGVDERFIEECVDEEISIGDYVLMGGELASLVVAETLVRLIPGVVGNERSISEESLENGLLKYGQYTKPREFEGRAVPDVLLSGDHGAIARWRKEQSLERTRCKRPDLWAKRGC